MSEVCTKSRPSQACLTVAFNRVLDADGDIHWRGYLKEHPDLIAYGIDMLENLIACVRRQAAAEEAKWRRHDVADGTAYDAGAEHHQEVAEFMAHQCNCEWCRCGAPEGDMPAGDDPDDPYADLLRAIDGLGDSDLTGLTRQFHKLALTGGRLAGVHDALARITGMVLDLRRPGTPADGEV
jgi:hypothetical protein